MSTPVFRSRAQFSFLHRETVRRFGGSDGIRDSGQVDSAMSSAMNAWHYGGGDLCDVAAAYAFHPAEAQAFIDGNKRPAAAAPMAFLAKNGEPVLKEDGSVYEAMIAIADHKLDKPGLAAVFRNLGKKN